MVQEWRSYLRYEDVFGWVFELTSSIEAFDLSATAPFEGQPSMGRSLKDVQDMSRNTFFSKVVVSKRRPRSLA